MNKQNNKQNKLRRMGIAAALTVILCMGLLLSVTAAPVAHNWYCVHVKDHVQPTAPGELAFIEDLDGFYIDHRHAAPDAEDKVIYLTFDVGYENGNVSKVLDVLKAADATGAFFILSNVITSAPELVERMLAEGHTVCNHTAHHKDMTRLDDAAFLGELRELETLCLERLGQAPAAYYRPPQGRFTKENLLCAKTNGYKTIFWSFAYPDWDNDRQMTPEKAKRILLDNVHNGEVMLLHPTSATNATVLGEVLAELRGMGYRFGRLDELTGGASCDGSAS